MIIEMNLPTDDYPPIECCFACPFSRVYSESKLYRTTDLVCQPLYGIGKDAEAYINVKESLHGTLTNCPIKSIER